ncbi:hypothetical protein CSUI_005502 [Cystoisospora suis]|uniref:Transmembrane protein n=1 Tax=Cystoisospora suis TaxID=483139 RepID=A0A2C6KWV0_9APIC|nr:hypothetical protein CSUI_005502 [Cystoisospora suis]
MEAVIAAPPALADLGTSVGKPGPTADTPTPERVSEESSLAAASFADRPAPTRRRRRHHGATAMGSRSLLGLLAFAVGLAVAVSALHSVIGCLQSALRQKGGMDRSSGIGSRRLVQAEETDSGVPGLPTYDEALRMSPHLPPDAPPRIRKGTDAPLLLLMKNAARTFGQLSSPQDREDQEMKLRGGRRWGLTVS